MHATWCTLQLLQPLGNSQFNCSGVQRVPAHPCPHTARLTTKLGAGTGRACMHAAVGGSATQQLPASSKGMGRPTMVGAEHTSMQQLSTWHRSCCYCSRAAATAGCWGYICPTPPRQHPDDLPADPVPARCIPWPLQHQNRTHPASKLPCNAPLLPSSAAQLGHGNSRHPSATPPQHLCSALQPPAAVVGQESMAWLRVTECRWKLLLGRRRLW